MGDVCGSSVTASIIKRNDNIHIDVVMYTHWTNCNQIPEKVCLVYKSHFASKVIEQ